MLWRRRWQCALWALQPWALCPQLGGAGQPLVQVTGEEEEVACV